MTNSKPNLTAQMADAIQPELIAEATTAAHVAINEVLHRHKAMSPVCLLCIAAILYNDLEYRANAMADQIRMHSDFQLFVDKLLNRD